MELNEPPFEQGASGQYRSNKGYAPLSSQEYPPPYDNRPMAAPYSPPAPVQQQQSSNNVVVVGNQPTPAPRVVHIHNAEDHLVITVFLFVCCLLLGNAPVMLCLFPALIFSCMASTYNDAGHNDLAGRFGSLACKCNIAAIIPAIIVLIAGIIVIIVVILIAVGVIGGSVDSVSVVSVDNSY